MPTKPMFCYCMFTLAAAAATHSNCNIQVLDKEREKNDGYAFDRSSGVGTNESRFVQGVCMGCMVAEEKVKET